MVLPRVEKIALVLLMDEERDLAFSKVDQTVLVLLKVEQKDLDLLKVDQTVLVPLKVEQRHKSQDKSKLVFPLLTLRVPHYLSQ